MEPTAISGDESMSPESNPVQALGVYLPVAHAVMEAGGETPPLLTEALARRLAAMLPGQVLQIVSLAPTAAVDIAS